MIKTALLYAVTATTCHSTCPSLLSHPVITFTVHALLSLHLLRVLGRHNIQVCFQIKLLVVGISYNYLKAVSIALQISCKPLPQFLSAFKPSTSYRARSTEGMISDSGQTYCLHLSSSRSVASSSSSIPLSLSQSNFACIRILC
jgi:hypothetical protein